MVCNSPPFLPPSLPLLHGNTGPLWCTDQAFVSFQMSPWFLRWSEVVSLLCAVNCMHLDLLLDSPQWSIPFLLRLISVMPALWWHRVHGTPRKAVWSPVQPRPHGFVTVAASVASRCIQYYSLFWGVLGCLQLWVPVACDSLLCPGAACQPGTGRTREAECNDRKQVRLQDIALPLTHLVKTTELSQNQRLGKCPGRQDRVWLQLWKRYHKFPTATD